MGVVQLRVVGSGKDLERMTWILNELPAVVPQFRTVELIKHHQNGNLRKSVMNFELCFEQVKE